VKNSTKTRLATLAAGASLAVSAAVVAAPAANAASPAATAFSNCMDGYITAQNYAYKAKQDKTALAILYTGYSNCYYALSQRTDISDQTEIDALNNHDHYYALASKAIIKAGVAYYQELLKKFNIKKLAS
jgi:hypothetical protein